MFKKIRKFFSDLRLVGDIPSMQKDANSLSKRVDHLQSRVFELEELTRNLVTIGVDVHFREPNMILIFSKINGGQIRHIDATFKDARELRNFVEELKVRFHTTNVVMDLPAGMPREAFEYAGYRKKGFPHE